jgi:hypothetical protein
VKTAMAVLAIGVTCLVLAASALAEGSLVTSYGGKAAAPQVKVSAAAAQKSASATAPKGTLPFTGLDVGFVVAGGIVLLAAGAALRRGARSKS